MSEFDQAVQFAHRMGHIIRAGRVRPDIAEERPTSYLFRWAPSRGYDHFPTLEERRGEYDFSGVLEFHPATRVFVLHLEVSHIAGVRLTIKSNDLGAFVAGRYLTIAQKAECAKLAIRARGQG